MDDRGNETSGAGLGYDLCDPSQLLWDPLECSSGLSAHEGSCTLQ